MNLDIFFGCMLGYLAGSALLVGYSELRSRVRRKRQDRYMRDIVDALREPAPIQATMIPKVATKDN